jgi:transcriptional regulator with XRE-family HTH domain
VDAGHHLAEPGVALGQLDVSLDAAVSARHLSFVETGRAQPSRELVLHLAEFLDVPLRERNALLLAAGYAPVYGETPLDAEQMAPVRGALDTILAGHAPYPAVIVDRRWDVVSANAPALAILSDGVAPELLEPPANALPVCLHPDGLAPRIASLGEYGGHLIGRLQRQLALSPDPGVAALLDELRGYPGAAAPADVAAEPAELLFAPLVLRALGHELRLFSTLATFGTALDITVAELAIESFFPARPGDRGGAARGVRIGGRRQQRPLDGGRRAGAGPAARGARPDGGRSPAAEGCGCRVTERGGFRSRGSAGRGSRRWTAGRHPRADRGERAAERRRETELGGVRTPAAIGFGSEDQVERAVHRRPFDRCGGFEGTAEIETAHRQVTRCSPVRPLTRGAATPYSRFRAQR